MACGSFSTTYLSGPNLSIATFPYCCVTRWNMPIGSRHAVHGFVIDEMPPGPGGSGASRRANSADSFERGDEVTVRVR
ncbi:MAG: hypothetical protein ACRELY_01760 [Polyangiaceae bacterium]